VCCLLVFACWRGRGEVERYVPRWRTAARGCGSWLRCPDQHQLAVYVWAVNSGHVVEASLGYFINPLLNVVLGVMCCTSAQSRTNGSPWRWRVRRAVPDRSCRAPPWIALTLAASFGLYA